jgi:DNA-binding response OmpR family regulator
VLTTLAEWLEQELTLTPVEMRIVRVLSTAPGEWFRNTAIIRDVWRDEYRDQQLLDCEAHTLRVHLSRIRHKLEPTHWRIENRYRYGWYRLGEV